MKSTLEGGELISRNIFPNRFGNFLCNTVLANTTDPAVIELAAKALARLAQVSGTYTENLKLQLIGNLVEKRL